MKYQLTAIALALGVALVPMAGQAAEKAGDKKEASTTQKAKDVIDDATITTKIKTEFAKDKAVSAMSIKVDTDKGVVKLTGNAKSKDEASKAESIAKSVAGVTSVKNDIQVTASTKK